MKETTTAPAYSVTAQTLKDLARARREQAREFRTALAKPEGMANAREIYGNYRTTAAELRALYATGWANVRLVNGATYECALPIGRLADWAKGETSMALEIIPDYLPHHGAERGLALRLHRERGGSVTFIGHLETAPVLPGYRESKRIPRRLLGDTLQLTAPVHGGEFKLEAAA